MEPLRAIGSSLTQAAYERLRDDVLSGLVRPGQKLKIHELAERVGASQGAVREALSRLASEGLVVSEPQKGFRACTVSGAELRDLTRVRIEIESLCLRRAIALGDLRWESDLLAHYHELAGTPERAAGTGEGGEPGRMANAWSRLHGQFHEALIATCDSPWLLRLRAQLFAQAERYRRLSVPLQSTRRDTNAEHLAIMEASIQRDAAKATAMLATHFEATADILIQALNLDEPPQNTGKNAPERVAVVGTRR